jgi:hypothetical protein
MKTEPDAFRLFATVRRHEHALKLAKFDLVVSETDLADNEAVTKVVLENESKDNPVMALRLDVNSRHSRHRGSYCRYRRSKCRIKLDQSTG